MDWSETQQNFLHDLDEVRTHMDVCTIPQAPSIRMMSNNDTNSNNDMRMVPARWFEKEQGSLRSRWKSLREMSPSEFFTCRQCLHQESSQDVPWMHHPLTSFSYDRLISDNIQPEEFMPVYVPDPSAGLASSFHFAYDDIPLSFGGGTDSAGVVELDWQDLFLSPSRMESLPLQPVFLSTLRQSGGVSVEALSVSGVAGRIRDFLFTRSQFDHLYLPAAYDF